MTVQQKVIISNWFLAQYTDVDKNNESYIAFVSNEPTPDNVTQGSSTSETSVFYRSAAHK